MLMVVMLLFSVSFIVFVLLGSMILLNIFFICFFSDGVFFLVIVKKLFDLNLFVFFRV